MCMRGAPTIQRSAARRHPRAATRRQRVKPLVGPQQTEEQDDRARGPRRRARAAARRRRRAARRGAHGGSRGCARAGTPSSVAESPRAVLGVDDDGVEARVEARAARRAGRGRGSRGRTSWAVSSEWRAIRQQMRVERAGSRSHWRVDDVGGRSARRAGSAQHARYVLSELRGPPMRRPAPPRAVAIERFVAAA